MFSSAKARAARTSLNPALRMYGAAMKFQWPGGVGRAGTVGPLVGDGQLLSAFRDRRSCRTSATSRAIRSDEVDGGGAGRSLTMSFRRHHPGPDVAEDREHRRARRDCPCSSRQSPRGPSAASASACQSAGDAAGGPHAVRAGARDEHRRHRLTQRQAGGDVAGRGPAREQCGLPLFARLERDLLHRRREEELHHLGVDAGHHRILGRIGGQVGDRHQRLDACCRLVAGRRAVVEVLVVPRRLQGLELRDRDIAVGARGVGRIGEREVGIRERIVRVGNRVGAVGAGRGRQVVARHQTRCRISFQRMTPPPPQ